MNTQAGQVTIIGAGLAGALLSIFLARRGYRVTLYEKRPDLRSVPVPRGRSINLALANRGLAALARVGLGESVEKLLIPMRGRMLHDEHGELQFQPYGTRPEEVIYSVSRNALNGLLMTCGEASGKVAFHFNQSCEAIDLEHNRLTLRGTTDERLAEVPFDMVIGCDGVGSPLRGAILDAAGGNCEEQPLEHGYKELSIPPGENGRFLIERHALHIWPRGDFMLIALPNLDGGFTVTLFLPNSGEMSFAALADAAAVHQFFAEHFADALALMPTLGKDFSDNPTGSLGTVRVAPWHYQDKALILGDAAHAIVPFHGQGMNCAFEDCAALDQCIEQSAGDWRQICRQFESIRKPNAEAIADLSLENYLEMRSTVRDPRFHLKKALAWRLEAAFPDRFIPRYSMVMFHHIPDAEAKRRGDLQNVILDELLAAVATVDDVDMAAAARLIKQRLDVWERE